MSEELKPCPFCGKQPHTESNNALPGGRVVVADCLPNCAMYGRYVKVSEWITRHQENSNG